MNAKHFFFERYSGFQEYPEHLLAGLTERQQRSSPNPSLNPMAWTLWHMARCEDMGVNRLVANRDQVLDDGGWADRMGVGDPGMGTGMSKADVSQVCERIDLSALAGYRAAVSDRTIAVVRRAPLADFSLELTGEHLERVFAGEAAGGAVADAIVESYRGQTKGWLLGHLALTHNFYHVGQAFAVRSLFGAANPW